MYALRLGSGELNILNTMQNRFHNSIILYQLRLWLKFSVWWDVFCICVLPRWWGCTARRTTSHEKALWTDVPGVSRGLANHKLKETWFPSNSLTLFSLSQTAWNLFLRQTKLLLVFCYMLIYFFIIITFLKFTHTFYG